MSTPSCTPVVVDGWGGAGDGCTAVARASGTLTYIAETLRAAYPERWQSSAADELAERLTDLLVHCGILTGLLDEALERAADLATAVAATRSEP